MGTCALVATQESAPPKAGVHEIEMPHCLLFNHQITNLLNYQIFECGIFLVISGFPYMAAYCEM